MRASPKNQEKKKESGTQSRPPTSLLAARPPPTTRRRRVGSRTHCLDKVQDPERNGVAPILKLLLPFSYCIVPFSSWVSRVFLKDKSHPGSCNGSRFEIWCIYGPANCRYRIRMFRSSLILRHSKNTRTIRAVTPGGYG